MNEKVEFDIIVDGKKAKRELKDIENELGEVEKQDKTTTSSMKANWVAVGSAVAVAGVAITQAAGSAMELEKATFGLNEATKDYIKNASEVYGITQQVVAGFVRTGKSAGMSGIEISKMIDQAVALSRAYPHESVETFIDNLTMLNRTGEAQGYIVDVLEQKWGAVDLKTKSTAEKMAVLEEATKGVNAEFDKTVTSKLNKTLGMARNLTVSFGNAILSLLDKSGALFLFNKSITAIGLSVNGYSLALNRMAYYAKKAFGKDVRGEVEEFNKLIAENEKLWKQMAGVEVMYTVQVGKGTERPEEQAVIEAEVKEKKAHEDKKKRLSEIEAYNKKVYSSMGDELSKFVQGGKMDFASLASSMIGDLIRIQMQKQITGMFGDSTSGGLGGFLSGFGLLHTGGSVGAGSTIPSYHTGMRSDERLAKLQVGESVVNRAGTANNASAIDAMNKGHKVGGSNVIVNIENNTGSEIQQDSQASFDGESWVISTVLGAVNSNKMGARDAFKGLR